MFWRSKPLSERPQIKSPKQSISRSRRQMAPDKQEDYLSSMVLTTNKSSTCFTHERSLAPRWLEATGPPLADVLGHPTPAPSLGQRRGADTASSGLRQSSSTSASSASYKSLRVLPRAVLLFLLLRITLAKAGRSLRASLTHNEFLTPCKNPVWAS